MTTAPITELKNRLSHYLRIVARGETVTILDRGHPIAQITPLAAVQAELERLAAAGLARLPQRRLSKSFWTRKLPRSSASVSSALEAERADRIS
ncbi:MAG TPA: type II toxin-antitoxin system prevent-host-death family antitoxin [Acidobacteriota bacterium]